MLFVAIYCHYLYTDVQAVRILNRLYLIFPLVLLVNYLMGNTFEIILVGTNNKSISVMLYKTLEIF
jgi:hypothetical protein